VSSTLAEINVVPLVDVMLVLLIIFMVTAPMIQRGVEVNLPVARRANTLDGERLFVTVPTTYRTDGMVYVGSDRVPVAVMQDRSGRRSPAAATSRCTARRRCRPTPGTDAGVLEPERRRRRSGRHRHQGARGHLTWT
jgi:hypothetical protein